ncbi:RidA family protein [Paraburkholderia nemoris]|uniref:RidA family protein n=1 Tax=Paraburkholderia nemoris TaxID=2793076 RepID=UPI0038B80043
MSFQRIDTPTQSNFPISNAVRAGKHIYTSQVPRDLTTGQILSDADITTQARQAFSNLRTALEAAGGTLSDVVQLTIYLTDADDFAAMNEVYGELFEYPYPNRATVVVKALLVPGMHIELVAQAVIEG